MRYFIILALSIIGGILYRLGGTKAGTKWRDLGLPTVMVAVLAISGKFFALRDAWWSVLCFGCMFASLTSYYKKEGTDAKWFNWMIVGFFTSFAMVPYSIFTGHWIGFGLRCIINTIFR